MTPAECKHENFAARVAVNRMPSEDGGPICTFMADVTVTCAACGLPFHFLGMPLGLDLAGAAVSVDRTEAHLAIAPGPAPIPKSGTMRFNVGHGRQKGGSS